MTGTDMVLKILACSSFELHLTWLIAQYSVLLHSVPMEGSDYKPQQCSQLN